MFKVKILQIRCICVCATQKLGTEEAQIASSITQSVWAIWQAGLESLSPGGMQSLRRGKKWRKAKRQRTLRNNHALPQSPTRRVLSAQIQPPTRSVRTPTNTEEPNRHSPAGFWKKAYAW